MDHPHSGGGDISRSLALMWEYDDRSGSRGPKPRLSLPGIVAQAVAIADADGLEAVSMRRVAADLGVGTMSLYRYVPGKEELLDLMIEHVSGVPEDADLGDDWRTAMETLGRATWELCTAHRWLPLVDQTRPLLGPNALRGLDIALGALAGTGLSSQEKVGLVRAIDAFAQSAARSHNSAATAEQLTGVSNEEFWKAQEPVLGAAMLSGSYPHMASLAEDTFDMEGEQFLELGLRLLLDGAGALVRARGAAS